MNTFKFFTLIVAGLLLSCKHTYYNNGKRFYYFEHSYNLSDTLVMNDYWLKSGVYDSRGRYKGVYYPNFSINEDSVWVIFKEAISNLNLNLRISENINNSIPNEFQYGKEFSYTDVNLKKHIVDSEAYKLQEETVILPLLSLSTDLYKNMSDGGSHTGQTLIIMLYIIKDGEVIYTKSLRQSIISESFGEGLGETVEDNMVYLEQHHWDSLVKWTMQEYLDRLR